MTHDGLVSRYPCCNVPTVSASPVAARDIRRWVNRHQLDMIEYLQEENRVLKQHLGGRRVRFTDTERRRLARRAHTLGRKVLNELRTLITPDTLPRWSWITTALTSGMGTLDVARLVGTSLLMIEKHYGHLVSDAARLRLANVEML